MNFKNVWFTLLWRILIIISTAYGIYAGVFLISGETNFKILLYYTMQSNLWCLILYSYIVVKMLYQLRKHQSIQKKICSSWLKGGLTSAILVTFLLYHLSLFRIVLNMDRFIKCFHHQIFRYIIWHRFSFLLISFYLILKNNIVGTPHFSGLVSPSYISSLLSRVVLFTYLFQSPSIHFIFLFRYRRHRHQRI